MSFDFSTLVTDRTQSDVTHWQKLHDKGWSGMTDEEKAEWNTAAMKGAYNYTDLNRVTAAMEELANQFSMLGYGTAGYQRIKAVGSDESKLPTGYVELEYIESTGTQYIDTGFKPNQDSRVTMDVTLLSQTDASVGLFGVRDINGANAELKFIFWSMQTGTQLRSDFFGTSANVTSDVSVIGKRINVDKDKTVCTVKEKESESILASLNSQPATGRCNKNMYLLGVNTAGEAGYFCIARLYSCQIFNSGVLMKDFVPCTSPDGTVGLYDTANGVFYSNAGTGTFIGGPTKEVVFLEYIESSGAQYINTDFNPTNNTHVVLRMSTSQSGSKTVFGSDLSWTGNGFTLGVNFAHYGTRNGSVLGLNDGAPHTLDFNKNVISLDGVKKLTLGEATFEMTYPIYLFCNNRAGAAQEHTALKLYSCKIYDQGYLVRDLVPCKSLTGIVGLYDRENSKFYKNIGSGAFVAGAEIVQPEVDPYEWKEDYYPTVEQMAQYIANLEALRRVIAVLPSTPDKPDSMELLDHIKANNIEKILVDIDKLLKNMPSAWFYSGEVECGEV